jgi:general secretion pathway protein A
VLIVDEAQSLSLDLLEEIRLLANIETDDEKLLSVVIAGQPELAMRLNDQALRQLKQRIALRCELQPLTKRETETYVAGRIRAAGGIGAQVFTREAVGLIFQAARGLPRTINVIADNALLGGFAAGVKPVTSEIVREVCSDFDLRAALADPIPASRPSVAPAHDGVSSPVPVLSKAGEQGPPSSDIGSQGVFAVRRKRFSFFWN